MSCICFVNIYMCMSTEKSPSTLISSNWIWGKIGKENNSQCNMIPVLVVLSSSSQCFICEKKNWRWLTVLKGHMQFEGWMLIMRCVKVFDMDIYTGIIESNHIHMSSSIQEAKSVLHKPSSCLLLGKTAYSCPN